MKRRPHYGQALRWSDHVIVVGLPRTGKTEFAKRLVITAPRVIYFDPKGDYVENGEPVAPVDLEDSDLLEPSRLRVAVQAGRDPEIELAAEFRYVVRKLRESPHVKAKGIVLVADEVNLYGENVVAVLNQLMSNGHHDGIVSVLISQRGVAIPLGCRALATKAYSFKQRHPKDLERLRDEFGDDFAQEAATWRAHTPPATWEQERFYE